ncbi:hypothetical protein J2TS4_20770 [Paenibacillus sp. J2TS4]|nr:hypothetical protein J2TS4_20770 [Paenibacillus sp. J2TS4]
MRSEGNIKELGKKIFRMIFAEIFLIFGKSGRPASIDAGLSRNRNYHVIYRTPQGVSSCHNLKISLLLQFSEDIVASLSAF